MKLTLLLHEIQIVLCLLENLGSISMWFSAGFGTGILVHWCNACDFIPHLPQFAIFGDWAATVPGSVVQQSRY